ncbi:MAG: peptidylprolyl isomerase [Chthoniobacter sp.]|uniref:peptidylprolyl isomerase n=1 Tax=Chthoniobacter sp. TaxID=2510640 RepID=UPI0032A423C2
MKKLLREPLLHFLVLGAAIFFAYRAMSKSTDAAPGRIVVTPGQIEHLTIGFTRTWQRPPSSEELEGLIRDYVREEICCREAVAMGLDKDDAVIRRRLQQKVEFISQDLAAQAEPGEAELRAYWQAHADAFRDERRFTFRQVYLNPQRHGANLTADGASLLAQLNQPGADAVTLGDQTLLEHELARATASEVAARFGENFATKLGGLRTGAWQGPIESGYGAHYVFVQESTEGRVQPFEEAREAVRREWANTQRLRANEQFYTGLLQRYNVTVERPSPPQLAEAAR